VADDRKEWRIQALERLHKELVEELEAESGIALSAKESAYVKERINEEIGARIKGRFEELKRDILDEIRKEQKADVRVAMAEGNLFRRFCANIRLQHFLLAVSTFLLIVTGLPLRFHDSAICKFIIFLLGGIQHSTVLHRMAAVGLMIVCVWHLGWLALTREGRRDFLELLPKPADVFGIIHNIKYFLRLTNEKARFGRYSYIEKFDYWAVYWGVVIMVGSGLFLWFEQVVLLFLPKFVLDIAKEMHRDEALLATLAIVIWHMYNAHLNPHKFPGTLVMWNGLMTKEEMEEEHPLEYEQIIREREGKGGNS